MMGQKNKLYYTGITELDLRKNRLSKNEENKLRYFTKLKHLDIRLNEIDSVDFVEYMPELERFELMGSHFFQSANDIPLDYRPLVKLKELKSLCIVDNTNNDLSFLNELTSLEYFQIIGRELSKEMTDCIISLKNLKELSIFDASFESTVFLKELKALKSITLCDCNIENLDVSDLTSISELEEVSVLGTHIDHIEKLAQSESLKLIRIGNEKYDENELKPLYDKGIEVRDSVGDIQLKYSED